MKDLFDDKKDIPDQPSARVVEGDDLIPKTDFKPIATSDKLFGTKIDDVDYLIQHPQAMSTDLMRIFIAARTPCTLWGPVGAAKTRTIESLANERDQNNVPYQVITVQPSTEDPTVIHGLMTVDYEPVEGKHLTIRSIPQIAQKVWDYYRYYRGLTILFLDEMTTCLPAQQNALLGLLSHGRYGDMDISPYVSQVMAANPEGTVSTVQPLSEAVINRGGHIAWYTDSDLWMSAWKTGFGAESRKPDDHTQWLVENLIDLDKSAAFRSPNWSIDELAPYPEMEMTARSTDNLGKMLPIINNGFKHQVDEIRHHYIIETTRSLLGPDWADKMRIVCSMESERVSPENTVKLVKEAGVSEFWSHDQLVKTLGDSLHRAGGHRMTADREVKLYEKLMEHVEEDNTFNPIAYQSIWALAATAPEANIRQVAYPFLQDLLILGLKQHKSGNLSKEQAKPKFVTEEIDQTLRRMIRPN